NKDNKYTDGRTADSFFKEGFIHLKEGRLPIAKERFEIAEKRYRERIAKKLSIRGSERLREELGEECFNVGYKYSTKGKYTLAKKYYAKATVLFEGLMEVNEYKYGVYLANCKTNLGIFMDETGNTERGLELQQEALELKKRINKKYNKFSEVDYAKNYIYMSDMYNKLQNYDKAMEYSNKYIEIFEKYKEKNDEYCERLANAYFFAGRYLYSMKDYNKSVEYNNKAIELFNKLNAIPDFKYIEMLASCNWNKGVSKIYLKEYEEAEKLLKKAKKFFYNNRNVASKIRVYESNIKLIKKNLRILYRQKYRGQILGPIKYIIKAYILQIRIGWPRFYSLSFDNYSILFWGR
nr:tetratricopeptide repeat protein [Lachnospiraceae bacterium]